MLKEYEVFWVVLVVVVVDLFLCLICEELDYIKILFGEDLYVLVEDLLGCFVFGVNICIGQIWLLVLDFGLCSNVLLGEWLQFIIVDGVGNIVLGFDEVIGQFWLLQIFVVGQVMLVDFVQVDDFGNVWMVICIEDVIGEVMCFMSDCWGRCIFGFEWCGIVIIVQIIDVVVGIVLFGGGIIYVQIEGNFYLWYILNVDMKVLGDWFDVQWQVVEYLWIEDVKGVVLLSIFGISQFVFFMVEVDVLDGVFVCVVLVEKVLVVVVVVVIFGKLVYIDCVVLLLLEGDWVILEIVVDLYYVGVGNSLWMQMVMLMEQGGLLILLVM